MGNEKTIRQEEEEMEEGTKRNSRAWSEVYRTTAFGNAYPTDGLVSIYHHFIKKELKAAEEPPKVLDFPAVPDSGISVSPSAFFSAFS